VECCGVEEVVADVERGEQGALGFGRVRRAIGVRHAHAAKADGIDAEGAKFACLHVGGSLCGARNRRCGSGVTRSVVTYLVRLRLCSSWSSVSMAGRHWAMLALGSRPSRMAAVNSRSCSSMPFIDTSTF